MLFFDFYLNSSMAYTTCYIDLTTESLTYNPIGPQGQWAWHRFGKRDYPKKQLPLKIAKKFIKDLDSNCNTIFLKCFYGDSLQYKSIVSLVKYAKSLNKDVFIFTYATGYNESTLKKLVDLDVRFYVHTTGIGDMSNLVYLKQNAQDLDKFLSITKSKTMLEYLVYDHNIIQVPEVVDMCLKYNTQLKLQRGQGYSINVANIIDDKGKWLHDALLYDGNMPNENEFINARTDLILCKNKYKSILETFTPQLLKRTAIGSNLLSTFTLNSKSKNILSSPKLDKVFMDFNTIVPDFKLKNNLFLSVTGHVFANAELYETFNNALCNDWYFPLNKYAVNKLSGRHQYRESYADNYIERVGSILERFTETELDDLHVGNNNLTDILSQYSSSFGYRYI